MAAEVSPLTKKEIAAFSKELKAIGKEWPRQFAKVNRAVAKKAQGYAQGKARGMGKLQARAADAIKASGTQTAARIRVDSKRSPEANAAFWGGKKRTGWYANPLKYMGQDSNMPEWVGNTWQVAVKGQGPYAINAALAEHEPELIDEWWTGFDELVSRAFPDN